MYILVSQIPINDSSLTPCLVAESRYTKGKRVVLSLFPFPLSHVPQLLLKSLIPFIAVHLTPLAPFGKGGISSLPIKK